MQNYDEKFINLALNLAQKNIGSTAENPVVGCVITVDNNILSTGVTAKGGRPHAEIVAMSKIPNKEILKYATIYITLEPCSHYGKTPPCVDEIIKYQIQRVVICSQDPNPKVNGNAVKKLIDAGIKTEVGIQKSFSQKINRGFFKIHDQIVHNIQQNSSKNSPKIPYIAVKIATSLDTKIATKNSLSKWLSSESSRRYAHLLRAKYQAIMVGAKTLIVDNPMLNCRISGIEENSPIQIVISNSLNFSFKENFFTNNLSIKKIVLCSKKHYKNIQINDWFNKSSNNKAIFFDDYFGNINIVNALEKLAEEGINSILIEGGSSLITQLIKLNLVDELIMIRSNKIIGNDGIPAIQDLDIVDFNRVIENLVRTKIFTLEQDLIEIFNRNKFE